MRGYILSLWLLCTIYTVHQALTLDILLLVAVLMSPRGPVVMYIMLELIQSQSVTVRFAP